MCLLQYTSSNMNWLYSLSRSKRCLPQWIHLLLISHGFVAIYLFTIYAVFTFTNKNITSLTVLFLYSFRLNTFYSRQHPPQIITKLAWFFTGTSLGYWFRVSTHQTTLF